LHELACQRIAEEEAQADERHDPAVGRGGKPSGGDLDHPAPAEGLDESIANARKREKGNRTTEHKQDREADRPDHAPQVIAPTALKIGQSTGEELTDRVGENSQGDDQSQSLLRHGRVVALPHKIFPDHWDADRKVRPAEIIPRIARDHQGHRRPLPPQQAR
jgi:hypothetical protein